MQWKGYRLFFFSREEQRMHVHVYCADGEAKFWLDPKVMLAKNYGLSEKRLREVQKLIEERKVEVINTWHKHFGG